MAIFNKPFLGLLKNNMDKLTGLADYFRKVPIAFLVAIISVVGLILFLPKEIAETLAVYEFRNEFRVFLGPILLLSISFAIARLYGFFMSGLTEKKNLKVQQNFLHKLTPEEKRFLLPYIENQENSIKSLGSGVVGGLEAKKIIFRSSNLGNIMTGFPYNLQPWAREYLEENSHLLR
ncbi:MAG: super-infection exclusion protein B [Nitrospinota bacterium]